MSYCHNKSQGCPSGQCQHHNIHGGSMYPAPIKATDVEKYGAGRPRDAAGYYGPIAAEPVAAGVSATTFVIIVTVVVALAVAATVAAGVTLGIVLPNTPAMTGATSPAAWTTTAAPAAAGTGATNAAADTAAPAPATTAGGGSAVTTAAMTGR